MPQAMNSDGQHQAGQEARREQAPDRGLGGDAVDDQRDRGRDQDAERAAGADRAGGDARRVAALAHLRHAHLADRSAGRGRRPAERREDRAGAEIRGEQPARHPVQPALQRLVQIGAGARAGDRAAHQDEHRDRQEREAVERRRRRCRARSRARRSPSDQTRKPIATMPRQNATGAPVSSTATVTSGDQQTELQLAHDGSAPPPNGACAPGHQRQDLGHVLQREQAHAERHGEVGHPERRPPDGLGVPVLT